MNPGVRFGGARSLPRSTWLRARAWSSPIPLVLARRGAGPGYQTPFAAAIKAAVRMPVVAVGEIYNAQQAETILRAGQADLIGLGRSMLDDPRWPWHAARELGVHLEYPRQYERARPSRRGAAGINAPGNVVPPEHP